MNNNNFNTFLMSLDKDLCQKGFFNLNLKLNGEIAHSYHKCIGVVVIFTIKQTSKQTNNFVCFVAKPNHCSAKFKG